MSKILFKEDVDKPAITLDTNPWVSLVFDTLQQSSLYFRYDADTDLDIQSLADISAIPMLVYALYEMNNIITYELPNENISRKLNEVSKHAVKKDSTGKLVLNYMQASFINTHHAEVVPWLVLAVKKYIYSNSKNIYGVIYADF